MKDKKLIWTARSIYFDIKNNEKNNQLGLDKQFLDADEFKRIIEDMIFGSIGERRLLDKEDLKKELKLK